LSATFIDLPEQRSVVHDVPNAIANFFEANVFAAKDLAQERLLGMEPERAGATHASDFEVRGIGGRSDVLGVRTGGGRPERRGSTVLDALVWAFVVVQVDNPTPIVLSLDASSIRGIHGTDALSRCTRY
jgi:hypothetical protein